MTNQQFVSACDESTDDSACDVKEQPRKTIPETCHHR